MPSRGEHKQISITKTKEQTMFREMRRKKQELSKEECLKVLKGEKRGVLSLIGDGGYPYGIPMNHYYSEKDGKIYFHCGKSGHKIDAIKNSNKASFSVHDEGYRKEGEWALHFKSVIVFGRIKFVEDHAFALDICRQLTRKFTDDEAYIEHEIEHSGPYVLCLELEIEHMTGKNIFEG